METEVRILSFRTGEFNVKVGSEKASFKVKQNDLQDTERNMKVKEDEGGTKLKEDVDKRKMEVKNIDKKLRKARQVVNSLIKQNERVQKIEVYSNKEGVIKNIKNTAAHPSKVNVKFCNTRKDQSMLLALS